MGNVNIGYTYKTKADLEKEWKCGQCGHVLPYPYDGEPFYTCPICGYIHGSRRYTQSPALPGFAVYK